MLSLPIEIQRQCVDYLDIAALKSTRLTSRVLRDVATEALFEVATIDFSKDSAKRFTDLCLTEAHRRYIRQVHINLGPRQHKYNSPDDECYPVPPPEWWKERVAEWGSTSLPNLNTVLLDSAHACCQRRCSALRLAFDRFITSGNIDTLIIKYLHDDCRVDPPDLALSATKPRKLHFLVTTWSDDASTDLDIELRHRHAFFNARLTENWLRPSSARLTHLTLHCDTYWGIYPRWQPQNMHFPHLKSLALRKWTIAKDWQIDFLTSHGETLEQLLLTRCPIMHASRLTHRQVNNLWHQRLPGTSRGGPPTTNHFSDLRWYTVLPRLAAGLPKLKHFSMGRGPIDEIEPYYRVSDEDTEFEQRYSLPSTIDSFRYVIFERGDGPSEWRDADPERGTRYATAGWEGSRWLLREMDEDVRKKFDFPDCLQEDREALGELLEAVRRRR